MIKRNCALKKEAEKENIKMLMIINITRGSNSYIRDTIHHNIMLSSDRGTIALNYFTMALPAS